MIDKKRDICIFTGAGFSCALFQQKTQNDFARHFINHEKVKDKIKYIRDDIEAIDDIELLMSHYHNLSYTDLQRDEREYRRRIITLRSAMALYYNEEFKKTKCFDNCYKKYIEKFLKSLDTERIFFVTTNYDLGIETVLNKIKGVNWYYPEHSYYADQLPTERNRLEQKQKSLIPIVKLHGSINWLEDRTPAKKGGSLKHYNPLKIYLNLLDDVELQKYRGCKHNHILLKHTDNRCYSPIMIPFFYRKEDWFHQRWASLFKTIIDHAKQYMENANNYYFIGYSLPPADHYTFSLLYNIMLSNNNKSVKCEIIDPAEKTTLKKLFTVLTSGNQKLNIHIKNENSDFVSYLQQKFDC